MIDLILLAVIVFLLAYIAFIQKVSKDEREKMLNAIIAKNANELRDLNISDHTKITVEKPVPPDLEPLENLSTEEHFKMILKNAQERSKEQE